MATSGVRTLVLVVDDDHEIVRLVSTYLEQASFQVIKAYNGEAALHALRREHPRLVILDLMLPDRDGWALTQLIRSDPTLANTAIIMLTARVEATDRIVGLELGADDYVTKPFNVMEMIARVRSVLRRNSPEAPAPAQIYACGDLSLDVAKRLAYLRERPVELTPTEFRLLEALIEYPGRVFTRAELTERAMGYGYAGLERTLDSHIRNLRKKIEPDASQPTYILTVHGVGYRLGTG